MDAALGGRGALRKYVSARRAAGRSWRQVTLDLHRDHDIEVSHETLRSWFPDLDKPAGGSPAVVAS
jgi:hypothetical protein